MFQCSRRDVEAARLQIASHSIVGDSIADNSAADRLVAVIVDFFAVRSGLQPEVFVWKILVQAIISGARMCFHAFQA